MTKSDIRAAMRDRRRGVASDERRRIATDICSQLLRGIPSSDGFVAVYLASPDEIDLTPFIETSLRRGVRLAAPRWTGVDYELAELNGCWPSGLAVGPHGIREPSAQVPRVSPSAIAEWIVPGLAFTASGQRLGYGGGWYDRLMRGTTGRRIGVAYDFQVLSDLPVESHDLALDEVVTGK